MRAQVSAFLALTVALMACREAPPPRAAKSALPTASEISFDGPVIVTSAGAVDSVPEWRIGDVPITTIRSSESDSNYDFYNTSDITRLSDGTIVVAAHSRTLRFFDRSGQHVRTVGREGDGPGEFRSLRSLQRIRGDSIVTFDSEQRRISIFDRDGRFGYSYIMPVNGGPVAPAIAANGSILAPQLIQRRDRVGKFREQYYAVALGPGGRHADTLVSFGGSWIYLANNAGGSVPFAPFPRLVSGGNRFYLTSADTYDVMVFEENRPVHRIHNMQPLRKVTHEDLDRYAKAQLDSDTSAAYRRYREAVAGKAVEYHAAINGLIASPDNHLWVVTRVATRRPDDRVHTRYHVYDRDGRLSATVRPLTTGSIREVGPDYVIVARWGEMMIDRIEVLPLIKP